MVSRAAQVLMEKKITTPKEQTEIDVWLESPGGDPNAAYKLYLELKSRAARFRVVIPDYAKSAATMLALGADEIWMGSAAELGPLDAQIEHPEREHLTVSALEVAFSLDYLARFSTFFIGQEGGPKILDWTKLPRIDVLREICNFTARLLQPAVGKLDPTLIHRASKQLKVAQRYAEIMLKGRCGPENDKSDAYVKTLVEHLVNDYPAHGVVVDRSEAERELDLPVRPLENYHRAQKVLERFSTLEKIAGEADGFPGMIDFFSDEELMAP
jgi:hypothetical protein